MRRTSEAQKCEARARRAGYGCFLLCCRCILRRGACRHIFGSTATRPRHCHCISYISIGAALRGKYTQQTAGGQSPAFGRRRPRSAAASISPCAHAYTQALFGTVKTATSVKHFWHKFWICQVYLRQASGKPEVAYKSSGAARRSARVLVWCETQCRCRCNIDAAASSCAE